MSTDTQPVTVLLEEAEAIVEAEWMRLTLDDDVDECALIAPYDETPGPRPRPPRSTPQRPRPSRRIAPHPSVAALPGRPVRATQRSPPAHTTLLVE